jgi:hypothetical protein
MKPLQIEARNQFIARGTGNRGASDRKLEIEVKLLNVKVIKRSSSSSIMEIANLSEERNVLRAKWQSRKN